MGLASGLPLELLLGLLRQAQSRFHCLGSAMLLRPYPYFLPSFKRCRLHFLSFTPGACYDIMTVGAFTAFAQKYKHGGLRRQLRQLYATLNHTSDGRTTLVNVTALLNRISAMRTAVNSYCEAVCRAAIHGDSADMNNSKTALCDKVRYL